MNSLLKISKFYIKSLETDNLNKQFDLFYNIINTILEESDLTYVKEYFTHLELQDNPKNHLLESYRGIKKVMQTDCSKTEIQNILQNTKKIDIRSQPLKSPVFPAVTNLLSFKSEPRYRGDALTRRARVFIIPDGGCSKCFPQTSRVYMATFPKYDPCCPNCKLLLRERCNAVGCPCDGTGKVYYAKQSGGPGYYGFHIHFVDDIPFFVTVQRKRETKKRVEQRLFSPNGFRKIY